MLSGNELIALVAAARLSGKAINPSQFMQLKKPKKLKTFKQFHKTHASTYADNLLVPPPNTFDY